MNSIEYTPVQTSPFTIKKKIELRLWMLINATIFRWTPYNANKFRIWLLRLFGADIDWLCSVSRKAIIDNPENLTMKKLSSLADGAWLRCFDCVYIGEKSCIGKDVYIIAASHNINSARFELITKPIYIGDNVWVATGSLIHMGNTIGDGAVIGACSVVTKNVDSWTVVAGNPAKFIKNREIKS